MQPSRIDLESSQVAVLNKGRFANALVRLCKIGDTLWVVKDFAPKSWVVRNLLGRPALRRELKMLQALQGLRGVPQDACRVDGLAIAYRHMPGRVLAKCPKGEYTPTYFPELEKLVHEMHERGIAHLDLRYMHNVLVCDDGTPGIIDFQSAIFLPVRFKWLSRRLRRIDISGVYKHWFKRSPETLDKERLRKLEKQNRVRKYWILTGYLGRRSRERKRKQKLTRADNNS